MRNYILFLLIFIFIFSCKKSEPSAGDNPPAEIKTTYQVDSSSTQPGLFVTLKASENIPTDTCTVQLGAKSVFLTRVDSFHYGFFTPVLSPGTYILDLKNLNSVNNPEVIIRNYIAISDPDAVVTASINNYNKLTDSLLINSFNNAVSLSDATFMHQLMDQLAQNIALCNTEEKLALAYQFQNMNLDNTFAQNANLDTAYLASRINGLGDEISSIMIFKALVGSRNTLLAIASLGAVVFTGYAVIKAPGPLRLVALASFGIAVSKSVYYTKAATKNHGEAISITGIAADSPSELNGNGTNANPVSISNNQSVLQKLISKFRTLRKSDETGLNNDISEFIKGTYDLELKDNSIKSIFDNIKSLFGNYFDKIITPYSAYVSPVLAIAKEKIADVKSEFVSVTNVDNPDITVTAVDDGANKLKLTFTNPANNITTPTNFTFQLTYTQAAINNKVTITEQAKFTPLNVPTVTTTIINSITQTTASSGGIITNDGGAPIVTKGICYGFDANPVPDILNTVPAGSGSGSFISNMTGLQPAKTYHIRAFASNNSGIGYGDDLSFTTLPNSGGVLIGGILGSYQIINGVNNYGVPNADMPLYNIVIQLTSGFNDLIGLSGTASSSLANSTGTITGNYSNANIIIVDKSPDGTQSVTRNITLNGTFDGQTWSGTYTNLISFTIDPNLNQSTGGSFGFQKQ